MTILDRIVETKRAEVAARKATIPYEELASRIARQTPPRGFRAALEARAQNGPALIAEIKKASPSKGVIRDNFDPAAHARAYEAGGATCLSVLTDERWFQGSDGYLAIARDACALPVLRKDFILEPWQVHEARAIGADAILLIVAAVDDQRMAEIEAAAIECGLDVLVEVHDAGEFDRAMALKTRLIGVNNRDLRDFSVDLSCTFDIAARAPEDVTIVAESGIASREDIAELEHRGVRCFLVGEALMRQEDVAAATRALIG